MSIFNKPDNNANRSKETIIIVSISEADLSFLPS